VSGVSTAVFFKRILAAQLSKSATFRIALFSTALGVVAGCSTVGSVGDSVGGFFAHRDPSAEGLNLGANPRPVAGQPATNPSDKPKVLPVASQDINCPEVSIADAGAALRVGGPDNASVRYQFNIADTARQCDPAGPSQAALKIGVKGAVVIGPAGSPGTFNAPLKITVTRDSDKTDVFSQTYRVEAATDGVTAGAFRVVTDPIMLPMSTLQLADVYSITVGFEGGTSGPSPTGHRNRKKKTSG
jgi:hypothetical protein